MHYIFNRRWIVEVLLTLPGVVLVMVSVWLGVIGEVLIHVVAQGELDCGWVGGGKRWGTSFTTETHIHHIVNHKFTIPSSISTLGDFSLSESGQPILVQPNLYTRNKFLTNNFL